MSMPMPRTGTKPPKGHETCERVRESREPTAEASRLPTLLRAIACDCFSHDARGPPPGGRPNAASFVHAVRFHRAVCRSVGARVRPDLYHGSGVFLRAG